MVSLSSQFNTRLKSEETTTTTTKSTPDVSFECDFEKNLCGWEKGVTDEKFQWFRTNRTLCSTNHGGNNCPEDSTESKTFFMYTFGGQGKGGSETILISPFDDETTGDCFMFMFNLKVRFLITDAISNKVDKLI